MATRHQLANTTTAGSAELALRKHGLTSTQLLKLAHAAAAAGLDRMKPPPPLDTHEREDLVASLLEYGLRWAVAYDPNLDQHRNFATSVYSRMRLRVTDWCRTNIHDARFGTDKRHIAIDPSTWSKGTPSGDDASALDDFQALGRFPAASRQARREARANPVTPWADTTGDAFVEPDFQDVSVSRMRMQRWTAAAERSGMSIEEWMMWLADEASADLEAA